MNIRSYWFLVLMLIGQQVFADGKAIEHAPIGVMGDHYHNKGEWMFSIRHMVMNMRDNLKGSAKLSDEQIIEMPNPYAMDGMSTKLSVVPKDMDMKMTMLGVMYAPSDRITLMSMVMFEDKEMTLTTYEGQMPMSMSNDNAMDQMGMPAMATRSAVGVFTTDSSDLSSISLSALIRLSANEKTRWHAQIGLATSLGDNQNQDEVLTPMGMRKQMILPYGMQSGDDSTSLITAITGVRTNNKWVYGGQIRRDTVLSDKEWQFGDQTMVNAWGQRSLNDNVALSLRLSYSDQGSIDGRNAMIMAPVQTANPKNYGGSVLSMSLGLNLAFQLFPGETDRVGFELTKPINEDLNGPQMGNNWVFNFGYQKSF